MYKFTHIKAKDAQDYLRLFYEDDYIPYAIAIVDKLKKEVFALTQDMRDKNPDDIKYEFLYARCLNVGFGCAKDLDTAIRLYEHGAHCNFAPAQYNLGVAYYNGNGVAKDMAQSLDLFSKASEQDNEFAKEALKKLGH